MLLQNLIQKNLSLTSLMSKNPCSFILPFTKLLLSNPTCIFFHKSLKSHVHLRFWINNHKAHKMISLRYLIFIVVFIKNHTFEIEFPYCHIFWILCTSVLHSTFFSANWDSPLDSYISYFTQNTSLKLHTWKLFLTSPNKPKTLT
jgi:hypothetical protein